MRPPMMSGNQQEAKSQGQDWMQLAQQVFQEDKRPIILYDGVCNLCNGGVNFMLDFDRPGSERGEFRFAALQSEVGRALLQRGGRRLDDISSIVLATADGKTHIKSDAILRIGRGLFRGTPLLPLAPAAQAGLVLVPGFVRDTVYDLVANNRYNVFGESDQCRLDGGDKFAKRFVPDPASPAQ